MTEEQCIAKSWMEISLCCPHSRMDEKLERTARSQVTMTAAESLYDQVHLWELWNTERLANLD